MLLEMLMEFILGGFIFISDRWLLEQPKGNSFSESAIRGGIYTVWLISTLIFSWLTVQLLSVILKGEGNWAIILVAIVSLAIAIWIGYRFWRYTKVLLLKRNLKNDV